MRDEDKYSWSSRELCPSKHVTGGPRPADAWRRQQASGGPYFVFHRPNLHRTVLRSNALDQYSADFEMHWNLH